MRRYRDLFSFRWNAELDIRSIKTFMNLNFVRCCRPRWSGESYGRRFWLQLDSNNDLLCGFASWKTTARDQLRRCQSVHPSKLQEVTAILRGKQLERYARLLLERIASCKVGHRPVGLNREL